MSRGAPVPILTRLSAAGVGLLRGIIRLYQLMISPLPAFSPLALTAAVAGPLHERFVDSPPPSTATEVGELASTEGSN